MSNHITNNEIQNKTYNNTETQTDIDSKTEDLLLNNEILCYKMKILNHNYESIVREKNVLKNKISNYEYYSPENEKTSDRTQKIKALAKIKILGNVIENQLKK